LVSDGGPTTHNEALFITVPGSACCQPGLQIYLLTLCGNIAVLGKVAHLGNVDFCIESKSAIHGTVARHAKWQAMATMPSLAKLYCKHHNYRAGVIAGYAGVIPFWHFTLQPALRWHLDLVTMGHCHHCGGVTPFVALAFV
jgi:hypothetical protein